MTEKKPQVNHDLEWMEEQKLLQPTLIASLASAASSLSTVAHDLVQGAVLSRIQRTVILMGVGVLIVLTAVQAVGVWEINKTTRVSKTNSEIIKDCTEPTGTCYKRASERTADAVGNISRVVVAAAYCARIPANDTQVKVEICVKHIILK